MDFKIEKIAELARLNLKPEEKQKLSEDLVKILQYVKSLDLLHTEKIQPTSHVLDLENVFREDQPRSSDVRDKVLPFAPHSEGKFFKVPKVVER